jgi:hypothetical protein
MNKLFSGNTGLNKISKERRKGRNKEREKETKIDRKKEECCV